MTDFYMTKDPERKTGQLPDKLTIKFNRNFAWWVVKQIILYLSSDLDEFSIDLLGTIKQQ